MLKYGLTHPEILSALGSAGHGSKVLIADGNYPFSTGSNPAAAHVYLNLEGREPDGVVAAADGPALLRRAARALADLGVEPGPAIRELSYAPPEGRKRGVSVDDVAGLVAALKNKGLV